MGDIIMRLTIAVLAAFIALPAQAQDRLNFDIEKLCQWQFDNNSMDLQECAEMENSSKEYVEANEVQATAERRAECEKEALSYAGDSGFTSYTVYATCLKDGPGSL
jgi:hypothetical protein